MAKERTRLSKRRQETAPGSLYTSKFEKKQKKGKQKTEPKKPVFVSFTKWMARHAKGFGKNAKYTPKQLEAMEFLGYEVSAQEYYGAYMAIFIYGLVLAVIAAAALFLVVNADQTIKMVFASLIIFAPIAVSFLYLTFPKNEVETEKKRALAYIPEIVNYLVMSMRLSPNLEKAVEFAASHGRGKIAEDMKQVVWNVQIGNYSSIEEGLDDLAYKWGDKSDDFKHALMLVRTSLIESNAERRSELLEKASTDVLEGSKEKMDLYARQLHQPTVYLYYFGILLPLLLAIILPIGSSFTGVAIARPEYLFLVYNIFLPIGIYLFGRSILENRPPTYVPPDIPENFFGLPRKGRMQIGKILLPYKPLAILLFAALLFAGFSLDQEIINGIPSYENLQEQLEFLPHVEWLYKEHGLFISQFTIFGLLLGASLAGSVYLYGKFGARKKIQDKVRSMETEFKDALYVLASRLGENRPMEEALIHTYEFLPKSEIANNIFKRIVENIVSLGMTLESAIFDPVFGAVKNYPSNVIRSGLRVMSDSVNLGVNVAAKSLISLSMQIRNAQKIDEMLRKLLEDVTVMLGTMATFIAPIVLAVVASLQKMIVDSLAKSCGEQTEVPGAISAGGGFEGMGNVLCRGGELAKQNADPLTFTLVMGIYVLEVVILLTYFNSQIEDTNNDLHTKIAIAQALPIATLLFSATAYVVGSALAGTAN